jgi:D-galactosamine 6-phosphate deaminase/isomerase
MLNYFGLTLEELEQRGGHWTAREIAQQPVIWNRIEQLVGSDARTAGFLEPLVRIPDLRIVLAGAGTSAFIGECLAPALLKRTGHWVAAVPTTDIVSGPRNHLIPDVPTLLVSFARSGNSPESTAAVELAQQCVSRCYHLVITCNARGALYRRGTELRNAHVVLLPQETDDRGFAMTSSFSGMLLAGALAFRVPLAQGTGSVKPMTPDLMDGWLPRLQSLVASRFERVVYLGANELRGLAREAALKMLELTDGRVAAIADTPLGFRHGPKTIVNGKTLVIVLLSNDSYTRQYDIDLLSELRSDAIAGRVLALTAGHEGGTGHPDDVLLPGLASYADLGLCLPFAVFAQSFALMQSLALGIRPDTPNVVGAVSRVVQGVTIYPLQAAR